MKNFFIFVALGVGVVLVCLLFFLAFKTFLYKIKAKKTLKECIFEIRYPLYVEAFKWVVIDILRGKEYFKLYGLWAFTGYYGEGKTLGCVLYAKKLQKTHPNRNIKIYSNINIEGQEKKITNWRELLDLPPNSIFIYDESQSDWSSNLGVRDFPEDLLRKLTQIRKKQLAIFMTSPVFTRMNINIRESVHFVIDCENIFSLDRLFSYNFYNADEYMRFSQNPEKKKREFLLFNETFAVSDDDYALYNTTEEVISLKDDDVEVKGSRDKTYLKESLDSFRNEIVKRVEDMIKQERGRASKS